MTNYFPGLVQALRIKVAGLNLFYWPKQPPLGELIQPYASKTHSKNCVISILINISLTYSLWVFCEAYTCSFTNIAFMQISLISSSIIEKTSVQPICQ